MLLLYGADLDTKVARVVFSEGARELAVVRLVLEWWKAHSEKDLIRLAQRWIAGQWRNRFVCGCMKQPLNDFKKRMKESKRKIKRYTDGFLSDETYSDASDSDDDAF